MCPDSPEQENNNKQLNHLLSFLLRILLGEADPGLLSVLVNMSFPVSFACLSQ
ncbi:hypothetical protein COMA1_60006 [Candidatus Nitrospira nitrosa]|uniref:Uncharacterized protein n=1 Tax=Candidatus Nitrospira nitrosa TaxID=1742972 RepID=A0A0S4LUH3_9BACT|nr:hypothetical protein COMA1_60006 [Candidatus Nitrospira nitrosa]